MSNTNGMVKSASAACGYVGHFLKREIKKIKKEPKIKNGALNSIPLPATLCKLNNKETAKPAINVLFKKMLKNFQNGWYI